MFQRPSPTDTVVLTDTWKAENIRAMLDQRLLDVIAEVERHAPAYRDREIEDIERILSRVQGEDAERILEADLNRLRDMTDQEFLLSFKPFLKLLGEAVHRKLVNPDHYEDDTWLYYETEDPVYPGDLERIPHE